MLIAEMDAAQEPVGIASGGSADTHIAMMVASPCHTGLVGKAEAVAPIVVPKTLGAHMTA